MDFKKELCESIIGDYSRENNKIISELKVEDIYNQTTLGIAMQYLDLTNGWLQENFDYINSRDGILNTYVNTENNTFYLTLRDILNL
jgi:uncharacterized protein YlxP (DUF503 family)